MLDTIMPTLMKQYRDLFHTLKPEASNKIDDVFVKLTEKFAERKDEFLDRIAALYSRKFTVPELQPVLDFYKTPVGQKFIRISPEIMQESMEIGKFGGRKSVRKSTAKPSGVEKSRYRSLA